MATIDLNNRNPSDPDGVYSLDSTRVSPGWVKDGDWSVIYPNEKSARAAGANNKISVGSLTTNDGRTFDVVIGANGTPISVTGDTTGQDDDVANRWKQTAPKPIPPGGSPTQRRQAPDGQTHIYAYNPSTGQYDTDQGAVAATAGGKPAIPPGGSSATEGTPDSSKPGGWDNSRPRTVIRDKDGNVVWSEELSGADLTAWRTNQQASQPQTGESRKPVEGRPGWTSVTRATAQGGNKSESTVYVGPDGKEVPTLPADNKPTQAADGSWGYWDQTGGTPKWTPIANGPAGQKYTQVKQDPTTGQWSGLTPGGQWEAISGGPGTGAPRTAGPTMPQIVLGHSQDAARQYLDMLNQAVAAGQMSATTRDQRWSEFMQTANLAVQEAATQQREIESTRSAQANVATSRATYAQNAQKDAITYAAKVNEYAPTGSSLGGQAFATMMGLSMLMEARSGLDSVSPKAGQSQQPALPTVNATTINNPQAMQSAAADVSAQLVQHATATAAAAQPAAGATGATGAATAAARPAASSAAAQSSMTAQQAAGYAQRGINPATGEPIATSQTAAGQSGSPATGIYHGTDPATGRTLTYTPDGTVWEVSDAGSRQVGTWNPAQGQPAGTEAGEGRTQAAQGDTADLFAPKDPATYSKPSDAGSSDYGQPGMRIVGQPDPSPVQPDGPTADPAAPAQYGDGGDAESRAAPTGGYAVLAPFMQQSVQPQQQADQQAASPVDQGGQHLALLHARASITEPWRMSADEIQRYRDAGVPEDVIWGVRRQGSAA